MALFCFSDHTIKIWRLFPFAEEALAPLMTLYCHETPRRLSVAHHKLCAAFHEPATASYNIVVFKTTQKSKQRNFCKCFEIQNTLDYSAPILYMLWFGSFESYFGYGDVMTISEKPKLWLSRTQKFNFPNPNAFLYRCPFIVIFVFQFILAIWVFVSLQPVSLNGYSLRYFTRFR